MSKDIVKVTDYAVMAHDTAELAEIIKEAAGVNGINPITDLDQIHIPAGGGSSWELPALDGTKAAKAFNGVIIHHQDARAYWAQGLEESGGDSPPDCSSIDGITGTGDPGGKCATCPLAQFGSDEKERGQACKALKLMYILLPDIMLPIALRLPPSSLKTARQYLVRLASHGIRPHQVITTFGLEPEKNPDGIKYSRCTLKVAEQLTAQQASEMAAYASQIKPALTPVTLRPQDAEAA